MTRNIFAAVAAARPSTRWLAAFPEGVCVDPNGTSTAFEAGDLVWVPTAWSEWRAFVRSASHRAPVVAVSLLPSHDEALLALEAGARGYCHALAVPELMREVEVALRHGGLWVGSELLSRVMGAISHLLGGNADRMRQCGLSPREEDVARLVAEGLSNKEIADRLAVGERTVKAHLTAAFEKAGVRDRLQLVLWMSGQTVDAR